MRGTEGGLSMELTAVEALGLVEELRGRMGVTTTYVEFGEDYTIVAENKGVIKRCIGPVLIIVVEVELTSIKTWGLIKELRSRMYVTTTCVDPYENYAIAVKSKGVTKQCVGPVLILVAEIDW